MPSSISGRYSSEHGAPMEAMCGPISTNADVCRIGTVFILGIAGASMFIGGMAAYPQKSLNSISITGLSFLSVTALYTISCCFRSCCCPTLCTDEEELLD